MTQETFNLLILAGFLFGVFLIGLVLAWREANREAAETVRREREDEIKALILKLSAQDDTSDCPIE